MSLRIISGERRGAKIEAPPGDGTRPLRDRVRQALFNALRLELRGAQVLDAFAGSGAVGLEALSNGAAFATFVELDPVAQQIIRGNITKLRFEERTKLLSGASPDVLARYKAPAPFTLLLLMPPYRSGLCTAVLNDPAILAGTSAKALAVCEIHTEEPPPELSNWTLEKERFYGITRLMFFRRSS